MSIYMTLRTAARGCVLDFLGLFAKPSPCVHILNGHMISRSSGTEADRQRFERLLSILSEDCDFVNVEEAVRLITTKTDVSRPTLAFTFDDGFDDCYTFIAPTLEKFGVNAMFFINPNFATAAEGDEAYIRKFTEEMTLSPGKRPMSWTQIKELHSRGFLFGAHTLDHYMIVNGDAAELRHQIIDCKSIMEKKLGVTCEHFAFPYGRLEQASEEAIAIACETYKYVYSQSDHKHYFSFGGRVINRRHFEAWWPIGHVRYFISCNRK